MTFYRPGVAWIGSWTFTREVEDEDTDTYLSLTIPPVSTTRAMIFVGWTYARRATVATTGSLGFLYSSTGTLLSQAGGGQVTGTLALRPVGGFAQIELIADAEDVAPDTPLAPYLADGLRYDYRLFPTQTRISALLTIMVLDSTAESVPEPIEAASGASTHYAATTGTATWPGSIDVWLDALQGTQVHMLSSFGAVASGLPSGNWWQAGPAASLPFRPGSTSTEDIRSISQVVAIAANDPASSTAIASPATYTLDASAGWAIMAYQSDGVLAPYVPPPTLTAIPSKLATIVG